MGRIKSTMIKKAAFQIYGGSEGFSEDFEMNKKLLINTMPSKSVRNKVAGQIARLAKQRRMAKTENDEPKDDSK